MRSQLMVATTSSLALLVMGMFSVWSLAFMAGAVIATLNFWALARVGQILVHVRSGATLTLLLIFYGKLILSGIALYVLIGIWQVPIWSLLLGLSTVVVTITAWGLVHFGRTKG
ncbi:ATP synthase subunit I [Desulfovibrio oxyclinae]|uniref:ATP synthase subunit I n=1 Tax=Desulfovibrio oxyclinae TaxID=63560 RepID=UPI001FE1A7D4|nr:ATP synthase subunit I [Desulfovibrio oxyclinae]